MFAASSFPAPETASWLDSSWIRHGLRSAILLLALLLRLWGAFDDLPYVLHPDEPVNLFVIQGMYTRASFDPQYFHYPSLFYDIELAAAHAFFDLRAALFGSVWEPQAPLMIAMGTVEVFDPTPVILFRSVTILLGVAAVAVCERVAAASYGPRVGLFAATLLALAPIAVADSRCVTPDTLVLLLSLLTVYLAQRVALSGSWRAYIGAGIALGLAVAAKYNAASLAAVVVFAHGLRCGLAPSAALRLFGAGALSLLTFAATSPYVLIDHAQAFTEIAYEVGHYARGHDGMQGGAAPWYLQQLWRSGGIALPLALLPLARLRGEPAAAKVVLAFVLVYCAFISLFSVRNVRTLLPALPGVLLLAAAGFEHLRQRLRHRAPSVAPILRHALVGAIAAALVLTPLRVTVREAQALTQPDSRATARVWIERNLPSNATIALESYSPFVDPTHFRVVSLQRAIDLAPDAYAAQGVEYVILSQGMFQRYFDDARTFPNEAGAYLRLMHDFALVKRFEDGNYVIEIRKVPPAAAPP